MTISITTVIPNVGVDLFDKRWTLFCSKAQGTHFPPMSIACIILLCLLYDVKHMSGVGLTTFQAKANYKGYTSSISIIVLLKIVPYGKVHVTKKQQQKTDH